MRLLLTILLLLPVCVFGQGISFGLDGRYIRKTPIGANGTVYTSNGTTASWVAPAVGVLTRETTPLPYLRPTTATDVVIYPAAVTGEVNFSTNYSDPFNASFIRLVASSLNLSKTVYFPAESNVQSVDTIAYKRMFTGYRAITGTATILLSDYVVNATSGTFTATLPTVGAGQHFYIANTGEGNVSVVAPGQISGADVITVNTGLTAHVVSIGSGNYILLNN